MPLLPRIPDVGKGTRLHEGHRHKDAQDKREPVADSWTPKGGHVEMEKAVAKTVSGQRRGLRAAVPRADRLMR